MVGWGLLIGRDGRVGGREGGYGYKVKHACMLRDHYLKQQSLVPKFLLITATW